MEGPPWMGAFLLSIAPKHPAMPAAMNEAAAKASTAARSCL